MMLPLPLKIHLLLMGQSTGKRYYIQSYKSLEILLTINRFDGKVFENSKIKVQKATAPKPPPGGWNATRGRGRGGRGGGSFRGSRGWI